MDEISGKETKYSFVVAKKPGIHWWSLLDTDEKGAIFLFDRFGSYGLLSFIVNNDLDVFKRAIPRQIKQTFKKDNKITLLKLSFKLNNYETETETARQFDPCSQAPFQISLRFW